MSRDRFPPGPTRRLTAPDPSARRRDSAQLLLEMAREYGDVAAFRMGRREAVLLSHPEDIEDVLVRRARCFRKGDTLGRAKELLGEGLLTSDGEAHLRRRRLAQPAFHRARVERHAAAVVEHACRLSRSWQEGGAVDIVEEMMRLALGIAADTLLGADLGEEAGDLCATFGEAIELYNVTAWTDDARGRLERVRGRLYGLVHRLIAQRRREREDRGDVLSLLLAAGLSDEELRDELLTLLIAGHETVANALSWTWHLLSEHPEEADRLRAELDSVLGDAPPTYADLERLPYTRAVLSESMRLYPPGWVIGRTALEEYEVGGYTLPEGTLVLVSQWVTHRDARWFPDPERFDPGRWAPGLAAMRPRYSYFPFGGGVRKCIGEGFAWMEAMLVLATLAREWDPRPAPGHPVEPKPLLTLRPRNGLPMTLVRRRPARVPVVSGKASRVVVGCPYLRGGTFCP